MSGLGDAVRNLAGITSHAVRGRLVEEIASKVEQVVSKVEALEREVKQLRLVCRCMPFDDVRAFTRKFGFPCPEVPALPTVAARILRQRLVREESMELDQALEAEDLPRIANESLNLLYVTYGALVDCGLRPEPLWAELHSSNMAKEPSAPGQKVRKPVGWVGPDWGELVREQLP